MGIYMYACVSEGGIGGIVRLVCGGEGGRRVYQDFHDYFFSIIFFQQIINF